MNKERYFLSKIIGETAIENEVKNRTGNRMTMALSLSLRASLEDPDNHKEKPLTCDMEPDIHRAQQLKLVYDKRKIKMKEIDKRTLADHIRNTPEPLSCDLEPDIEINKI